MKIFVNVLACVGFGFLLAGCGGNDAEDPEGGVFPVDRTFVVFNPAIGELPIPNDLLFSGEAAADGTMFAGVDPSNPVVTGIDALDGNSVLSPFDVEFTGSLSKAQTLDAQSFVVENGIVVPNPNQNVFLLPLTFPSGDSLLQASADLNGDGSATSVEVPTFSEALAFQSAVAANDIESLAALATPKLRAELISLDGGVDNVVRITPLVPLDAKTKYLVVLTGLIDVADNPVFPNVAYETIRNPDSNLSGIAAGLAPLRPAVQSWEQLASGYFSFMQQVFDSVGLSQTAPTADDILMTLTFTTAGTTDVLTHIAAPETFFSASLTSGYKKAAIVNAVTGRYPLNGSAAGLNDPTDIAITQTLGFLLTSSVLPDNSPNPLFQSSIAAAIQSGADYASIAGNDATAAFVIQSAAAQAAIQVHDSGDQARGDAAPFVSIQAEAAGTVLALSGNNPAAVFPLPTPKPSRFFRVDPASTINPALVAPARVYQGQITLPQYTSSATGVDLVNERWQANEIIGQSIDAGRANPAGTTPPSDRTTYRYPFPAQVEEITVPLLSVLPDDATLANFGIAKPEQGWPVVIHIHGITSDRSSALPSANAMAFACVRPDLSGVTGLPCFATIAIDQPQHGLAPEGATVPGLFDASDPAAVLEPNLPIGDPEAPSEALVERHFGFTANAAAQPIPMNYELGLGRSGSLFINLSNFENVRDKLRQMVLDLLSLNASIPEMDVDGNGLADDLDFSRVYVIGNSLGGINGIPFVAVNNSDAVQTSVFSNLPKIQAAAMLNTGGGLPRLLTNSNAFAPTILQGLAAASDELTQGKSGFESYVSVFQGVLDSVDPMNFADMLADTNSDTGILLTEIIGNGTTEQPSDLTIPNAADALWGAQYGPLNRVLDNGFAIDGFPAPLAGTEPLIAQFGADKSAEATGDGDPNVLVSRFVEGSHGNVVSAGNAQAEPFSSAAVFSEMVSQFAIFFANNGTVSNSIVTNTSVVED